MNVTDWKYMYFLLYVRWKTKSKYTDERLYSLVKLLYLVGE
jgi:hypothetical protein